MKTVLFVEDQLKNQIVGFEGFIDDIQDQYDVSVCPWYTDGLTPEDCVPDLETIVADDTSWRAIILADLSEYGPAGTYLQNPYDFLGNGVVGPTPVLTLAQILGGVPKQFVGELQVRADVEEAYDFLAQGLQGPLPVLSSPSVWVDGLGGLPNNPLVKSIVQKTEDSLGEKSRGAVTLPVLLDRMTEEERSRVPSLSDDGPEDRVCATFDVCMPYKRHHVRWGRPSELLIVTPRNIPQDYNYMASNTGGKPGRYVPELSESQFWMRNSFPSQTRYIVFDRPEPPTVADDYHLLLLITAALQIAQVEFVSGELEAYKLYKMNLDVDRGRLGDLVRNKHDILQGALDVVPRELRRIYADSRPVNRPIQNLMELHETIECVFNVNSAEDLYADAKRFGMTKQRPRAAVLDEGEWRLQYKRMRDAYFQTAKLPRRALRAASERFNLDPEHDEASEIRLNNDQIEDLTEELHNVEFKLAGSTIRDPFAAKTFEDVIGGSDEEIRENMGRRPFNLQAVVLGLLVLFAFLLGSVPYIFGLAGGDGFNEAALVVSLGVAGVLMVVCLLGLLHYRNSLRRKMRKVNDAMEDTLKEMRDSSKLFGGRLSNYATYRNSYPVLQAQFTQGMSHVETERVEEIKRINAELVRGYEENEKLMCVLNCSVNGVPRKVVYDCWGDVEQARREGVFESFFCEDTRGICTLNGKFGYGRSVDVPYDYIKDISMQALPLRDADTSAGLYGREDAGGEAR